MRKNAPPGPLCGRDGCAGQRCAGRRERTPGVHTNTACSTCRRKRHAQPRRCKQLRDGRACSRLTSSVTSSDHRRWTESTLGAERAHGDCRSSSRSFRLASAVDRTPQSEGGHSGVTTMCELEWEGRRAIRKAPAIGLCRGPSPRIKSPSVPQYHSTSLSSSTCHCTDAISHVIRLPL